MAAGKQLWVFADGDLPPHPDGAGDPIAHEALMVVNAGQNDAQIRVTVLFEEREPREGLSIHVPARRVRCFRMDQEMWGDDYRIPFGQYALVLESDEPIVAVFGRLDRRQNVSYYSVAPFSA